MEFHWRGRRAYENGRLLAVLVEHEGRFVALTGTGESLMLGADESGAKRRVARLLMLGGVS